MSQLLSYYKLCPITNEIVGIAEDSQRTSIICTLGKKIVYILRVSWKLNFLAIHNLTFIHFSSTIMRSSFSGAGALRTASQAASSTISQGNNTSESSRRFTCGFGRKTPKTSTKLSGSSSTNPSTISSTSKWTEMWTRWSFMKTEPQNRSTRRWNRVRRERKKATRMMWKLRLSKILNWPTKSSVLSGKVEARNISATRQSIP